MLGAIAGDIIGSIYESRPIKTKDFPLIDPRSRFTDDSVLTVAIAEAILTGGSYLDTVRTVGRRYPHAGYGGSFYTWLFSDDPQPYNSWGNGAAMRVSPVGFAFDTREEVLKEAQRTAEITHNHPEGIKGAQAVALAVFLARSGKTKEEIGERIGQEFGYDVSGGVDAIRPDYRFDISCQGTVPAALISFLDSFSYEDAVRNAVSLGGDSDTLACITGGIAEAYYGGIPLELKNMVCEKLPKELWEIVNTFYQVSIQKRLFRPDSSLHSKI